MEYVLVLNMIEIISLHVVGTEFAVEFDWSDFSSFNFCIYCMVCVLHSCTRSQATQGGFAFDLHFSKKTGGVTILVLI